MQFSEATLWLSKRCLFKHALVLPPFFLQHFFKQSLCPFFVLVVVWHHDFIGLCLSFLSRAFLPSSYGFNTIRVKTCLLSHWMETVRNLGDNKAPSFLLQFVFAGELSLYFFCIKQLRGAVEKTRSQFCCCYFIM